MYVFYYTTTMYKIVLLLLATSTGCEMSVYTPVNTALVADKPMTMSCGVHPNETMYRSQVEWKFQSINNTQPELLFNGYNMIKMELDLFVINNTGGEFNLLKNRTRLEDAGAYHCIKRIHQNQSIRSETNIAQLTILESDPVCGSNTSNGSVIEGDLLRMSCSVSYLGNLNPVMEWSRSDGGIVDSAVIYSKDKFPRTVTHSRFQMMNYSDHNALYICKTYFKKATVDSEKENLTSATNAPYYQAECNLTVNVLFGPRDLSISPIKTEYYNGGKIHCSAVGNPTPTYQWMDVDTGYVVNGATLIVKDESGEGKTKTYQCKAANVVSVALEYRKFYVAAGSLFGIIDLKYIAIMMGIICAMLLIIVIYFGREHIKGDTSNYELESYAQFTVPAETGAFGIASINLQQKVGCEAKVEVPIYADVDQRYRSESDCKDNSLAETTKKKLSAKMNVGLDGTVYMEVNSDGGLHRSQPSATLFRCPMFNKSEYASIDHTVEPLSHPQRDK